MFFPLQGADCGGVRARQHGSAAWTLTPAAREGMIDCGDQGYRLSNAGLLGQVRMVCQATSPSACRDVKGKRQVGGGGGRGAVGATKVCMHGAGAHAERSLDR